MFSFTKKFAITSSLVTFFLGQFVSFASDGIGNNIVGAAEYSSESLAIVQALAKKTIEHVAKDNMGQILTLAACDGKTDPRGLRLVCQRWRNIIDEFIQKDRELKHAYAAMVHPISKSFVKATCGGFGHDAFYETFAKLKLICQPTPNSKAVILPFLSLYNPFCGTFNLDGCRDAATSLRFTTSLKDFFQIEGKNKNKLVILFTTRSLIAQRIRTNARPFENIKDHCTADFCMFLRMGNEKHLDRFDYLVTRSLDGPDGVCSENLSENWNKSKGKLSYQQSTFWIKERLTKWSLSLTMENPPRVQPL